MNKKTFSNELERALARPDIDQLRKSLETYQQWSDHSSKEFPDEIEMWFDSGDDFDRGLALVMLAAATYDDARFLCLVAAGLLEDLVKNQLSAAPERRERVLVEPRKTPRFPWMLSCVWTTSADEATKAAIAKAVGKTSCDNDPLPPRPWA